MEFRLAIFDIDGTLIRTGGAGLRSLARAFRKLFPNHRGLHNDPDLSEYSPHGKTDPLIFREIFRDITGRNPKDSETAELIGEYLALLPEELSRRTGRYEILPGVLPLLDHLEKAGVLVGLGTGNLREGAEMKLKKGKLWHRFRFGGFGADGKNRSDVLRTAIKRGSALVGEPVPPERAIFFGDTTRDIEAVHAVGGRIIAVATGNETTEELRKAAPALAVETLSSPLVASFLRLEKF
ncbi:MAG: HAD family hydrolase [Candidatus Hydrogenedentota bacterium]|nr:MAG: HAD family hydrolase [Candidatus Hydrogenedentota bacterium]